MNSMLYLFIMVECNHSVPPHRLFTCPIPPAILLTHHNTNNRQPTYQPDTLPVQQRCTITIKYVPLLLKMPPNKQTDRQTRDKPTSWLAQPHKPPRHHSTYRVTQSGQSLSAYMLSDSVKVKLAKAAGSLHCLFCKKRQNHHSSHCSRTMYRCSSIRYLVVFRSSIELPHVHYAQLVSSVSSHLLVLSCLYE